MHKNIVKLWIGLVLILSVCFCGVGCNEAIKTPEQPQQQTDNTPALSENTPTTNTENNIPTETEPAINPTITEATIIETEYEETSPVESNEPEETENTTSEDTSDSPSSDPNSLAQAYQDYYNMSAEEQQNFINSFESIEAFFAWHTAAKQAYEDNRTPIDGSKPIIP